MVGWPGSVCDSTVFNDSDIYKNLQEYFTRGPIQYVIADAGYTSESWLCTPYGQSAASFPQNRIFNELFSSVRVIIEHLNGVLKGSVLVSSLICIFYIVSSNYIYYIHMYLYIYIYLYIYYPSEIHF